jgi:NAD-dependent deacetylase
MSAHIFILTGAGISKESGLDTFRDADGIWSKYKIENVCTPDAFLRDPDLVHEFYNGRRQQLSGVVPNDAHHAIARLQRDWPGQVTLVTQNIDDLHNRALAALGVHAPIIQMHGKLLESLCADCGRVEIIAGDLSVDSVCPQCQRAGCVRPNIVWFGEMPYHMNEIYAAVEVADIFIAIGTSGTVYPAAGLVHAARSAGCKRAIELNLEKSEVNQYFTEHRTGPATQLVPALVQELLSTL